MSRYGTDREGMFPLEQIPYLSQHAEKDVQLYVQIYDVLYELIRSGTAIPGSIIPGENDLAAHFNVSRGTIRQALRYLEEDGLVVKRQGRGSEVTNLAKHQLGGLQEYTDVCREFCTVPISDISLKWKYTGVGHWLSEQLALSKGALLLSSEIVYHQKREAVALSQRLVPVSLLERFSVNPDDEAEMKTFLLDTLPQNIARSRTEIMVRTDTISDAIRSGGIPFLSVSEITYDAQDKPLAHFKNYLRSDCYRLYLNRHRRGH